MKSLNLLKKAREALKKPHIQILFLLTILALTLRLYNITNEALWVDEAISLSQTSRGLSEALYLLQTDIHPPLYTILLWLWTNMFGQTEIAVRTLSALIGTMITPATYLLGKELQSKKAGLLAATLTTISPFLITYSQEARMYTLFMLLSILSTYYAYKYSKNRHVTGYLVTTILLIYTHYLSWILILAQALYVLTKHPNRIKKHLLIGLGLLASYIPWNEYLRQQLQNLGGVSWIQPTTHQQIIETMIFLTGGTYMFSATIFLLLLSTLYIYKEKKETYLLLLTLFPPTILVLLSFHTPLIVPRYIAYLSVFIILLISTTIDNITTNNKQKILIALLLIVLTVPSLTTLYKERTQPSWDKAAEELQDIPVGVVPDYEMLPLLYYTDKDCFKKRIHTENNQTYSNCSNIQGYQDIEDIEKTVIAASERELTNTQRESLEQKEKQDTISYKNSPKIHLYYER